MLKKFTTTVVFGALMATSAFAEVHDVQMLNRGEAGTMIFEPDFLHVAPGDTVRFVATDKGHNVESIEGMLPEGATAFEGTTNEEIEVTLDTEGVYGVRCKPHFAMGMVMTIAVGDAVAPDDFLAGRLPRKAKERFEAHLSSL
jgi:pseudoazurin